MNKKIFSLMFGLVAIGFIPAYAQQSTQSEPPAPELSLLSAMRLVDATHPLIRSKQETIAAAESGKSAAWQERLPSLGVSRSAGATEDNKGLTTVRLRQPLYAGGRINAGINRADAGYQEASASLQAVQKDLMNRTATAYIEVIKARDRLSIAKRNVETHQSLLDSIGRRVGAEVSPESDLVLTQSRLAQAQSEEIQVQLAVQRAEEVLKELIASTLPQLARPAMPDSPVNDLMTALERGLAFAPELKVLRAQEMSAQSEVEIQRAALFPNVFVNHERRSGDVGQSPKEQTFVGIEFAPGAGFSVGAQVQAAERRRLAAIEASRNAEKDIRDKIRLLWAERESLKRQVNSVKLYVAAAQSVAESFSRQFSIGRKSWLDLLNSQRESLLAELSLAETQWNALLLTYKLEIETGQFPENSELSNQGQQ